MRLIGCGVVFSLDALSVDVGAKCVGFLNIGNGFATAAAGELLAPVFALRIGEFRASTAAGQTVFFSDDVAANVGAAVLANGRGELRAAAAVEVACLRSVVVVLTLLGVLLAPAFVGVFVGVARCDDVVELEEPVETVDAVAAAAACNLRCSFS